MANLTFRIDDVSYNTKKSDLLKISEYLIRQFPDCKIIYAISLISRGNKEGTIYPGVPFKHKDSLFFYKVNRFIEIKFRNNTLAKHSQIFFASHGLLHIDHSKMGRESQEMSILTSCKFLKTDMFIPPFNKWNLTTQKICEKSGISLVKMSQGWKSLEFNHFDRSHNLWYFHPWRFTFQQFKEAVK